VGGECSHAPCGGKRCAAIRRSAAHVVVSGQKKTAAMLRFVHFRPWAELLFLPENADIGSLRALLALRHFEFNALVFGQGFETAALDFLEVREEVLATAIRCDEPKTLAFVEPLNQTSFSHINPFGECRRHADIEETLTNHRTS
jgi:hypothetical protein